LKNGAKEAQKQLAKVRADGNRYLLARIPVVESDGTYTLSKEDRHKGKNAPPRNCMATPKATI